MEALIEREFDMIFSNFLLSSIWNSSTMHFSEWLNHSNVANYMFLMQSSNYTVSSTDEHYLVRITLTGCGLSLVGCIMTLFIICFLPRQKGDGPFIVGNLATAILLSQLSFIGAENAYPTKTWCKVATAILHYLFLSIHFWSLCFALHLMMKLIGVLQTEKSKRRLLHVTTGWLLPTFIVGLTAIIRGDTYGTEVICWLTAVHKTRWAFLGPIYAIMMINFSVTIIMLIARALHDNRKLVPCMKRIKHLLLTFTTLVPVLSLTWVFGLASSNNMFSQYLFVMINSSQGLWILVGHMMFSSPVKALLLTKAIGVDKKDKKSKKRNPDDSASSEETEELQYNCPAEASPLRQTPKPPRPPAPPRIQVDTVFHMTGDGGPSEIPHGGLETKLT
ncbi:hypothetical protein LOTGIDRAFT_157878 [Lottia gigantea]|uniref:G-protein coupled receptors family 2 profile 2 domain-containing protein n=1 Tax=Lottia gigantea TaxID=225164 RepID=V4ATH8_LOTGI|nr:hypothetical protein LOTGIDRAFT_157878 [Lottia gigantea]ESP00598.1 hypothetical protein LOTGIDRAFT_157878 [Lottia gigantea]